MLFSSMIFLWAFLPAVITINFILNQLPFAKEEKRIRVKNLFLLFASIVFYAWGGIYYLLIMFASILINYFGGYFIAHNEEQKGKKRLILIVTIVLNLGMLFWFKYFNMLTVIIESCMHPGNSAGTMLHNMFQMQGTGELGWPQIVLPIGISFFTFQAMSYVIDVYRQNAKVQKNILDFALYVALFPQLIAGPIVKYSDIEAQLGQREENVALFTAGIKRFCYGLGKKIIFANTFAVVCDSIWKLDVDKIGAPIAWLGMICYTLQIYYDFSGYSDMAIGIGKMLGFHFKENFQYPYISISIQEFWRRWHISLSTWFKEYVYIPLGGNRKGKLATYRNLFLVFLLTGIWHGANFTFLVWGMMYAVLLIIERIFLGKLLDKNPVKIINWCYTIFMVMIGWVYFRSTDIYQANTYILQLFSKGSGNYSIMTYLSVKLIIHLVLAILCMGVVQKLLRKRYESMKSKTVVLTMDFILQILMLVYAFVLIISGTYNPFIYFQF